MKSTNPKDGEVSGFDKIFGAEVARLNIGNDGRGTPINVGAALGIVAFLAFLIFVV